MQLSAEQLARYDRDGYLLVHGLFAPDEVDLLRGTVPQLMARQGPEVLLEESDAASVKIIFGAHFFNDVYRTLSRHPRLVQPSEQIVGDRVHIFQSRLNPKLGFTGGGWGWHQDFNQWWRFDGMKRPHAALAGIFLDEINACNGPLLVIPGSHHAGHLPQPGQMELDTRLVEQLVSDRGIDPILARPGAVLFFHSLLVHASAPNVSPWPRRIFYFAYNAVSNRDIQPLRARHHCDTDQTPIEALGDDCLRAPAGTYS
jgi:ectoine hydroxylase